MNLGAMMDRLEHDGLVSEAARAGALAFAMTCTFGAWANDPESVESIAFVERKFDELYGELGVEALVAFALGAALGRVVCDLDEFVEVPADSLPQYAYWRLHSASHARAMEEIGADK